MLIFRVFSQFKRKMKGLQDCSKTLKMVYKTKIPALIRFPFYELCVQNQCGHKTMRT